MKDYDKYKRRRQSPQIIDVQSTCSLQYNMLGLLTRHQLYIPIMWCNRCQRIQALNLKQKPRPLTKQLMKSLDCYHRTCAETSEKHTPAKSLVIEQLIESRATPLLVFPQ